LAEHLLELGRLSLLSRITVYDLEYKNLTFSTFINKMLGRSLC
jgi:hypothetical protein